MLLTEYFAVAIKDLPDHYAYGSIKELKALLWNHLETVMAAENHIKWQFKPSPMHSEIVNIHFGMKSFGKMKILLDIYADTKEKMREEAR